jgi:hypothetical protein
MEIALLKEKKSIEDSVENEENVYPVSDPNKRMINISKESSDTYKKIHQGGNL